MLCRKSFRLILAGFQPGGKWTLIRNRFNILRLCTKSDTTCFSSVESQLRARWQLRSDG